MGEVYRAYDTVRERMVALKVLRPDVAADPVFQDRFRRKSRIAARLQKPHVIPLHDCRSGCLGWASASVMAVARRR